MGGCVDAASGAERFARAGLEHRCTARIAVFMTGADAVMAAVDSDFVDGVTRDLRPGKTAIVVEANERSTRAVADIVKLGGGHVYRQEVAQV